MSTYVNESTVQTAVGETQKYLSQLPDAKDAAAWAKKKANEALAGGYEAGKAAIYEYAYAQARDVLWQVSQSEIGKQITSVGNATYQAGAAAAKVLDIIKGGKLDSNGVVDVMKNTEVMVGAFAQVATIFGANPDVVAQIQGWTSVAVGCAGAMTAPPLTVVACAAQVVIQALSSIIGLGGGFTEAPAGEPRAVFSPAFNASAVSPDAPTQATLLQVDASRLASVLRYQYGIPSFAVLARKLAEVEMFEWWREYPPRPVSGGTMAQNPPVGMDMMSWLVCLDRHDDAEVSHANIRCCLDYLSVLRAAPAPFMGVIRTVESGLDGEELVGRTADRGDVNVALIELGAWVARGAIAATGKPLWLAHVNHTDRYAGIVGGANWELGLPAGPGPRDVMLDFYPFLVADELLNYFTAVSFLDYTRTGCANPEASPVEVLYRSSGGLPLRFYEALDSKNRRYSGYCWTSLTKARRAINPPCYAKAVSCATTPSDAQRDLGFLCLQGNPDAMKELAFVRLLCAASLLYMHKEWGGLSPEADGVAALPSISTDDPLWRIRAPISPHQAKSLDVDRRSAVPPLGAQERWELRPGEAVRGLPLSASNPGDYLVAAQGLVDTGESIPAHYSSRSTTTPARYVLDILYTPPRTVFDGVWLRREIENRERVEGALYRKAQLQAADDNFRLLEVLGPSSVLAYAMVRGGVNGETLKSTSLLAKNIDKISLAVETIPKFKAMCAAKGGRVLINRPCPVTDRGPCGAGSYFCDTKSNVGLALGIAAAAALWLKFRR